MAIEMWKGQVSEIVDNKIVRQRLKDGWTFEPSKPQLEKVLRKPRATLKANPVVKKQTINDLPGPEDLNLKIEE
jgi:hypothetical protein